MRLAETFSTWVSGLFRRSVLEAFVGTDQPAQNAVDIFKGRWASKLPEHLGVAAGEVPLFDDDRIRWMDERFGIRGKSVIELGPLEGGHSYMLEQHGAKRVVAIESNTQAYLRCLVVKELLELTHTRFLCADFVEHLKNLTERFDLCVASGVLYHMANPAELITLVSRSADAMLLWTHYYDREIVRRHPHLAHKFQDSVEVEHEGFHHTLYRKDYGARLYSRLSLGGPKPYANWMARDEILACLEHAGMHDIQVRFEDKDHGGGPCFAVLKNTRIGLFSWHHACHPPPRQRCARGHAVPTRGPATPAAGDQGHLASRFRNRTKL